MLKATAAVAVCVYPRLCAVVCMCAYTWIYLHVVYVSLCEYMMYSSGDLCVCVFSVVQQRWPLYLGLLTFWPIISLFNYQTDANGAAEEIAVAFLSFQASEYTHKFN